MRTLSDPGPCCLWVETLPQSATIDNRPSSYATENSDEEPLEGRIEEHVEAMLALCLDPDERSDVVTVAPPETLERYQAAQQAKSELDLCKGDRPSQYEPPQGGGDDDVDGLCLDDLEDDDEDDLDMEELEMSALARQVETLEIGVHEFNTIADVALLEAEQMEEAAPAYSWDNATLEGLAASTLAPTAQLLQARCLQLRELQLQVRSLALEQQALFANFVTMLLKVCQSQARALCAHVDDSKQRLKQLEIVRRENARLCSCLEAAQLQLGRQQQGKGSSLPT